MLRGAGASLQLRVDRGACLSSSSSSSSSAAAARQQRAPAPGSSTGSSNQHQQRAAPPPTTAAAATTTCALMTGTAGWRAPRTGQQQPRRPERGGSSRASASLQREMGRGSNGEAGRPSQQPEPYSPDDGNQQSNHSARHRPVRRGRAKLANGPAACARRPLRDVLRRPAELLSSAVLPCGAVRCAALRCAVLRGAAPCCVLNPSTFLRWTTALRIALPPRPASAPPRATVLVVLPA